MSDEFYDDGEIEGDDAPDNVRYLPTPEEAARQGGLTDEEIAEVRKRAESVGGKVLILLKAPHYFVRSERLGGKYAGPFRSEELRSVLERESPSASGLSLPGKKSETLLRTQSGALRDVPDLFQHAGTVLERVKYVAHVPGSSAGGYDPARNELTHEVARWRDVPEEYNPQIAEWLERLCGQRTDKVLDWLATFRRTDTPTCAPYVEGIPSAGKEMLAAGLASMTEYGRIVRYEHLASDFNDLLLESLFVFADEKMPDQGSRRGAPSAVFRQLIGTNSLEINGKGVKKVGLSGCPRVLICANNARALNLVREQLEHDDVEAIGKRVLHVRAPDRGLSAKEFLRGIGGRETTRAWVDGLGIARHVAWLERNRSVVPGVSYLVEGDGAAVRKLIVGHEMDLLLEALCAYMARYEHTSAQRGPRAGGIGSLLPPVRTPVIAPGNGVLFVHGPTLSGLWGELLPGGRHVPGTGELGRMLANLSEGRRVRRVVGGSAVWGYEVRGEDVAAASMLSGVGDPDRIRALLDAPLAAEERQTTAG